MAPGVWEKLIEVGARPAPLPDYDDAIALCVRRSLVEKVLRDALAASQGVEQVVGHIDDIDTDGGRVRGVVVDGRAIRSDVVVVATGRHDGPGANMRPAAEVVKSGLAYTSRQYRAREGVDVPATSAPISAIGTGYVTTVVPQDNGYVSVLIVRPVADRTLLALREPDVFERVAGAVPNTASWVDAARFVATAPPQSGPEITNTYRAPAAAAVPRGCFFAGDAVMTTNPTQGRGIVTGLSQASALVDLMRTGGDMVDVAREFERWCDAHMKPWFDDHVSSDPILLAKAMGSEIEFAGPSPSSLVIDAMGEIPAIADVAIDYLEMMSPPTALDPFRDEVGARFRAGWRPAVNREPAIEELVAGGASDR
jgi:2-polyprenyl-6-methoxyphenol hydroxylase-like FAD-dependent oxidoreductase